MQIQKFSSAVQPFMFQFGAVKREALGGPYREKPQEYLGVKMAVEINAPCDIDIPTRDFDVPRYDDLDRGVRKSLIPIAQGKKVYFGCMGGLGRSGLYAAALAKALGITDPVKYVRANFKPHAVETEQQVRFVNEYEPSFKTRLTASIAKAIALAY